MTIGWWLLPALVTIAGFGLAIWMNQDSGDSMLDVMVNGLNYIVFGAMPSMCAWLVWALWRMW